MMYYVLTVNEIKLWQSVLIQKLKEEVKNCHNLQWFQKLFLELITFAKIGDLNAKDK